jgi:hypothetical protein
MEVDGEQAMPQMSPDLGAQAARLPEQRMPRGNVAADRREGSGYLRGHPCRAAFKRKGGGVMRRFVNVWRWSKSQGQFVFAGTGSGETVEEAWRNARIVAERYERLGFDAYASGF